MNKHKLSSLKKWIISVLLKSSSEKGYVLLFAISLVLAVSALVALYAKNRTVEQLSATATLDGTSGFYAAEAALNQRADAITKIYQANTVPKGESPDSITACLETGTYRGSGDFQCDRSTIRGATPTRSNYITTTHVRQRDGGVPRKGSVPPGDLHAGLNMLEYLNSVFALAFKESELSSPGGKRPIAALQMDIKNRLIPLFQFAAFYREDLEIFPGAPMTLSGPVHTNGNLYIGGQLQAIRGEVTTAGNYLFRARKETSPPPTPLAQDQHEPQVRIPFQIPTLRVGIDPLGLPEPDFLNADGEYFQKADIRIEFTPSPTSQPRYGENIPFTIEVVERTTSTNTPVAVPVPVSLSEAQRRSLRQPVLVSTNLASIPVTSETFNNDPTHANFAVAENPNFNICRPPHTHTFTVNGHRITPNFGTPAFRTTWENLTDVQRRHVAEFAHGILVETIQRELAPVLFSRLNINPTAQGGLAGLTFAGRNIPNILPSVQTPVINALNSLTPQEIASLPYRVSGSSVVLQRCFIPAPLIDIGRDASTHNTPFRFINSRENNNLGRDMRLLQINMTSLVVWNKEGQYWNGSQLRSANQLLFKTAPADNTAPANSFQARAMAARDTSDEGLVIYATIDGNIYPNASTRTSPYGFVLVQGHQLPGLGFNNSFNYNDPTGLTFASDQAVYVQGDFNTRNKQPAAILADSINVLSNNCFDPNRVVHRLNNINCNNSATATNATLGNATRTVINAAFLGGNDITTPGFYNGGLENYPRMHENWTGVQLRYRGSFVSLNVPNHVSGRWPGTGGRHYTPPNRLWDYDLMFNDARNLPPLTPRFSSMKQEQFIRSFEQD